MSQSHVCLGLHSSVVSVRAAQCSTMYCFVSCSVKWYSHVEKPQSSISSLVSLLSYGYISASGSAPAPLHNIYCVHSAVYVPLTAVPFQVCIWLACQWGRQLAAVRLYGTAIQQPIRQGQPTYTHYKVGMFR